MSFEDDINSIRKCIQQLKESKNDLDRARIISKLYELFERFNKTTLSESKKAEVNREFGNFKNIITGSDDVQKFRKSTSADNSDVLELIAMMRKLDKKG